MRATVPASSANLGPGFDVLALALRRYVEVEVRPAARLSVRTDGEGADMPQDETHLAARVVAGVLGHDRFEVAVRSTIPPARGLGSSAALALAAAAAAGAADPLAVAAAFDGHAENAAASLLGGLVAATTVDGRPLARRLPLDPELVYVLLVPARELSTSAARRALPAEVPFADATFELGRMGLLVAGLADRRQLVPEATDDRLHQERRAAALFPEAPVLLARLAEAGALGACWSGAGPSLLGIVERSKGASLRDAGEVALADLGVAGESVLLEADLEGLRVEPGEP